jgi:glutamate/tyrosine decarboxylase-like PLP-dependent enzyme
VVAAREAHGLGAAAVPSAVVYVSAQTHHSMDKALRVAGLGEAVRRAVPLDGRHRMRPDALRRQVAEDRAVGLRPWLLVATAGSTDAGAVDPLAELAEVAAGEGLWLHVDAAYGGAFALCEPGRRALAGIERSDSLVLDPHKGLFAPFGTGVVLVRDGAALRRAFAYGYRASYLQDAARGDLADASPSELSPELTRPFRGLRVWLALRLAGVAAFRAALEEKLLLARYAHGRLAERAELEVGPEPDLSVVTFRLRSPGGDADAANLALTEAIQRDGRIYLSSTRLDGRVTLRLAILNARTHRADVDLAVEVIAELAGRVIAG